MYANMGTPSLTHVRFVANGNAQTGGGADVQSAAEMRRELGLDLSVAPGTPTS